MTQIGLDIVELNSGHKRENRQRGHLMKVWYRVMLKRI